MQASQPLILVLVIIRPRGRSLALGRLCEAFSWGSRGKRPPGRIYTLYKVDLNPELAAGRPEIVVYALGHEHQAFRFQDFRILDP